MQTDAYAEAPTQQKTEEGPGVLCWLGLHSWIVSDACAEKMAEATGSAQAGLVVSCCRCKQVRSRDVSPDHPACCLPHERRSLLAVMSPEPGSLRSFLF